MTSEQFLHNVLNDLRGELTDEFDRNFERNAFFDTAWPETKHSVTRGSLMQRTGGLRGSIKSRIEAGGLHFSSSLPYSGIHNEGGTITITDKMIKFFWAMYYKTSGAIGTKKDGSASKSKRNIELSQEAGYWKALALKKVGDKITIPQRQFIGHHPQVDVAVQQVCDDNVKEFADSIATALQAIHK
jgi:phage gpG-like protein